MFTHTPLSLSTLSLLSIGSLAYAFVAGFFGLEILAEIAILAVLVIALDLVAGFGGMVSLCHGALLGVGAYAFTVAANEAGLSAFPAMVLAMALSAALAFVIGAVCAHSIGIYFIMATLAFGQMAYSFVFQSPLFGGDDGLSGAPRPDLSAVGIDLTDSRAFAIYAIAMVALTYLVAAATLRSGLGRSLVGLHHNEKRLRALGLTVWRAKATAFAISGALAGLAGCLAAQHTQYISPDGQGRRPRSSSPARPMPIGAARQRKGRPAMRHLDYVPMLMLIGRPFLQRDKAARASPRTRPIGLTGKLNFSSSVNPRISDFPLSRRRLQPFSGYRVPASALHSPAAVALARHADRPVSHSPHWRRACG